MRGQAPVLVVLATALAGCGLLLGVTDDPVLDPTVGAVGPAEAGDAPGLGDAPPADAGNDVHLEAEPEEAGDDAAVDPDV
ncbi:MAG: hypothetical protein JST00_33130 [Deltaproteobacteria bacterium]|nr:hypothetical protein [Deltaproteobacteria bacterium]